MAETDPKKVRFEYIKSNLFRMVHADGAYGGVTPRLGIFLSFYCERPPIPKAMVHGLKPDGSLDGEIKSERETRNAIVREAEVGIVLDADVAKNLVIWLQEKLEQVEKIRSDVGAAQSKSSDSELENIH